MDCFLNMCEQLQPKQEENIDEEKLRYFASKITILVFFGIPHWTYLAYSKEEKSSMFREYYQKFVLKYFSGNGKKKLDFLLFLSENVWIFFVWCFWCLLFLFSDIFLFWFIFLATDHGSTQVNTGISKAVRWADKISMTKSIFGEGRVETTLTAKKSVAFKRNTSNFWEEYDHFK